MAEIIGSGGKVFFNGKEIGNADSFSLTPQDESDDNEIAFCGIRGLEATFSFELPPEATQPLGIVDHLIWGPRLN